MDRSLYSNIMQQKKYSPNISRSLLANSENDAGLMGRRIATEKEHIITMNKLFAEMLQSLDEFKFDKLHFDDLTDVKSHEVLMSNRLIKNEVVDMADVIEQMSDIVLF